MNKLKNNETKIRNYILAYYFLLDKIYVNPIKYVNSNVLYVKFAVTPLNKKVS